MNIKLISIFITILYGCAPHIQILETKSTNAQVQNKKYVFETDSLKITYTFWCNNGIMAYTIYNKLNIPLYIDWKKSSFISNDNKFDCWVDEENTTAISYYGSYYYKGYFPFVSGKTTAQSGTSITAGKTIKPERITSIPPHSKIEKAQFILFPFQYCPVPLNSTKKNAVPRKDIPNKQTTIYETEFTSENSPLRFRNYLVLSISEKFEKEFYTDNGFFVSKITEMNTKYHRGKLTSVRFKEFNVYEYPFTNEMHFYLSNVPNIERRPKKKNNYK